MSNERRKYSRATMSLPLEVYGYACEHGSFSERTETINVSPLGSSFRISQPLMLDDIVRLTLPMPQQLRLFDFDADQYQIYAQVRRTRLRADGYFNVGVAFISKTPPEIELSQEILNEEIPPKNPAAPPAPIKFATSAIGPNTPPAQPAKPATGNQPAPKPGKSEQVNLKLPTIAQNNSLSNDRNEPRAKLRLSLSIRGIDKQGQHFNDTIQTEDVSKHGLCFVITRFELELNSIVEIVGFQGKFNAQGEIRHSTYNQFDRSYRIGIRLLGEPTNWIVK